MLIHINALSNFVLLFLIKVKLSDLVEKSWGLLQI